MTTIGSYLAMDTPSVAGNRRPVCSGQCGVQQVVMAYITHLSGKLTSELHRRSTSSAPLVQISRGQKQ